VPANTDLLFYEGLHGAVVTPRSTSRKPPRPADRRGAGDQPGVDPEALPRQAAQRGYSTEAVTDTILRRMPDYVHYICPQFDHTHVNFQRVPMVDTSQPLHRARHPAPDESMVVIRFANPRASTSRTC
jgi:phosphoribulokinase